MRFSYLIAAAALAAVAAPAAAQVSDGVVKFGVLNDQQSLYADIGGPGSTAAAQLAIDDFGGKVLGKPVELVFADNQNKPDVGVSIATKWFDTEHVDVLLDGSSSAVSLALSELAHRKHKVFLASGAASSDLTGKACHPDSTIHWVYDTYALAHGTGAAVVKAGGKSWFFITADYAFGHALERDVSNVVKANGGTVLGDVKHPLNTSDFSSYLLQAQASKAQVIGLANAGGDTINTIKQAAEFGITQAGQKLAGLLVFITDVHSLGLQAAQGLQLTGSYYWDMNDKSRSFAKRFAAKMNGRMPSGVQAGVYSSVWTYLKAVEKAKSDEPAKVMAAMREMKTIDDPIFGKSELRPDGLYSHDMYLFEVKKPSESKGPWDYYKLVRQIPAAEAFQPLAESTCPEMAK